MARNLERGIYHEALLLDLSFARSTSHLSGSRVVRLRLRHPGKRGDGSTAVATMPRTLEAIGATPDDVDASRRRQLVPLRADPRSRWVEPQGAARTFFGYSESELSRPDTRGSQRPPRTTEGVGSLPKRGRDGSFPCRLKAESVPARDFPNRLRKKIKFFG